MKFIYIPPAARWPRELCLPLASVMVALVEHEHGFWASPECRRKPRSHVNRAEQDSMILYRVTLLTLDCTRGFHQVQSDDSYLLSIFERKGETIQNALSDFGV